MVEREETHRMKQREAFMKSARIYVFTCMIVE